MAPESPSGHPSFDIDAEVRLGDSLWAALWPPRRRVLVLSTCLALLFGGTLLGFDYFPWFFAFGVVLVVGVHAGVAWLVHFEYEVSGGKPKRMRFHVCGSGVEVRGDRGRQEWIVWGDMLDVRETPLSFLLRPSQIEQYVIPKRCFDEDRRKKMREILLRCYLPARELANPRSGL